MQATIYDVDFNDSELAKKYYLGWFKIFQTTPSVKAKKLLSGDLNLTIEEELKMASYEKAL